MSKEPASAPDTPAAPTRAPIVVLGLIAAALCATAWMMRVRLPAGRTGARPMAWHRPDGVAFRDDRWTGCRGDTALRSIVDDERVWLSCEPGPGFPDGGLGVVEPLRGAGHIRWPFPPGLKPAVFVAVRGGPRGELAVVYRTAIQGPLVGGVAGATGWIVAPAQLAPAQRTLRGLRWAGGVAEAAIVPDALASQVDPATLTVDPAAVALVARLGGATTVPSAARCQAPPCRHRDAVHDDRAGWQWIIQEWDQTTGVADDRGEVRRVERGELPRATRQDRGLLDEFEAATFGIDPVPAPQFSRNFRLVAGAPEVIPMELEHGEELRFVYQLDDAAWKVKTPDSQSDGLRIVVGAGAMEVVAHDSAFLGEPILIPAAGDRVVVMTDRGNHIVVDASGRRVDPLDVAEHLRRRGSVGAFIDEMRHVWLARWAWYGPLLCLVIASSLAVAARRRRRAIVMTAMATYVVVATIALIDIAPLLR